MGKRRDRKQMIQREKERVPVFFRAIHLRGNCSHSICRSRLCGKGYLYLEALPKRYYDTAITFLQRNGLESIG